MSVLMIQKTARFPSITAKFNPIKDLPICVCCLSQQGPFTTLFTCAHVGFFNNIEKFVITEDSVVCKLCHNILRKFALFKEQVIENLIVLQQCRQKPYRWPVKIIYNMKKRVTSSINIHSTVPNCYKPEIVDPVTTEIRSSDNEAALTREAVLNQEATLTKEAVLAKISNLKKRVINLINIPSALPNGYKPEIVDPVITGVRSLANEAAPTRETMLNQKATLANYKPEIVDPVITGVRSLAKEAALARKSVLAKKTPENNYNDVKIKIEPDTIKKEEVEVELDPFPISNQAADVDRQLDEIGTQADLENDIPSYHVIGGNRIVVLGLTDVDEQKTEKKAGKLNSKSKPTSKVLPEEETYTTIMPKIVNSYGNVTVNFDNVKPTPHTIPTVSNSAIESPMPMRVWSGPSNDSKNAKVPQTERLVGVPKDFISSLLVPLIKIAPKPGIYDKDTPRISNELNFKEVSSTDADKTDDPKLDPAYSGKISFVKLTEEGVHLERQKKKESKSYIKAPYKCESCVEPFNHEESYEQHKDSKHSESLWVCKICQMSVNSNYTLQLHQSKHYSRFKCEMCGEMYNYKRDAARHYKLVHGDIDETFFCNRCDFTTKKYCELRAHKKDHRTLSCPVCKKLYMRESKFILHVKNCIDGQPKKTYPCKICKRVSQSLSKLRAHMKNVHNDSPSDYCAECKLFFKTKYNYQNHLLCSPKHGNTSKKPKFQCDHCEQWFHSKEIISRHIYLMHMASDNECPICKKNFTSPFQLKVHYGVMHKERSKDRPYICNHCAAAFAKKEILESHLRIHSDERPFKCVNCPASFKLSASRYTHNRLVHKVRGGIKKAPKEVEMTPEKVRKTFYKVETTTPGKVETTPDMVQTAPFKVESIENVEMTPVKVETLDNVEMASTNKNLASRKRKRKAKKCSL